MRFIYDDRHRAHHPRYFLVNGAVHDSPEVPERGETIAAALRAGGRTLEMPPDYGRGPLAQVHTAEYLRFLAGIHARWQRIEGASEEVIPNIHPNRHAGGYPASAAGQAGYHMADTACPIGPDTWNAACRSANSAVHAAQIVCDDGETAYALCRPPGHHAFRDMAGGFCFINNTAVAAERLRRCHERVAILDVDLHHGNGTQDIFYSRADVLTVSLHADPMRFYPFFWGHPQERGEGRGLGYNLNLPLVRGTGNDHYLEVLAHALDHIDSFAPDALVVALGLDAYEGDPLAGLAVTTPGFTRIGSAIAALGLPTVVVQEGGYLCDALGQNAVNFLDGFEKRWRAG